MIIAFSFLSLLNDNYRDAISKFNMIDTNDWLHFDVMDGKFVSNITFDYSLVREINNYNHLYKDVHLMINNPLSVIKDYKNAGCDQLTFHYESQNKDEIKKVIQEIKDNNMKVGISIKPNTPVEVLEEYLDNLDYILIMSVEPGRGGQKFMESSLNKIKYLKKLQESYNYLIGVDGGINNETAKLVKEAGADVVVVGSYLAENLNKETLTLLR